MAGSPRPARTQSKSPKRDRRHGRHASSQTTGCYASRARFPDVHRDRAARRYTIVTRVPYRDSSLTLDARHCTPLRRTRPCPSIERGGEVKTARRHQVPALRRARSERARTRVVERVVVCVLGVRLRLGRPGSRGEHRLHRSWWACRATSALVLRRSLDARKSRKLTRPGGSQRHRPSGAG